MRRKKTVRWTVFADVGNERSEAIGEIATEKSLLGRQIKSVAKATFFYMQKGFEQGGRSMRRKKTVRWTVFADVGNERSEAIGETATEKSLLGRQIKSVAKATFFYMQKGFEQGGRSYKKALPCGSAFLMNNEVALLMNNGGEPPQAIRHVLLLQ